MIEYHKIQTLFKRDEKTRKVIVDDWSCPEFEYLKNNIWLFEEKIDGTNIRIHWDGNCIFYGGRTDNSSIPQHLLNYLQKIFNEKIEYFKDNFQDKKLTLYGEGYGRKIQKAGDFYHIDNEDGVGFRLFDINIEGWWLLRDEVKKIADNLLLRMVVEFGEGTLNEAVDIVKQGFNSHMGDLQAEGLILRPAIELKKRNGERIIAKLKTRDFN